MGEPMTTDVAAKNSVARVIEVLPGVVPQAWRITLDDGRELTGWRKAEVIGEVGLVTVVRLEFVAARAEFLPLTVVDATEREDTGD